MGPFLQDVLQLLDPLRPEGAIAVDPVDAGGRDLGIDAIVGVPALAALAHQAGAAQGRQMLRDRRLRNRKAGLQLGDAHLAPREPLEDGAAGRVGQGAEDFGFDHGNT